MASINLDHDSMSPYQEPRLDPEESTGQNIQSSYQEPRLDPEESAGQIMQFQEEEPLETDDTLAVAPSSPAALTELGMVVECSSLASTIGESLGEQIQLLLTMKTRIYFITRYLGEIRKALLEKKEADTSLDSMVSVPDQRIPDSPRVSPVSTLSSPRHCPSLTAPWSTHTQLSS